MVLRVGVVCSVAAVNVDDYLTTTQLLDCQGRATHTLTLLLDGRVRVRTGAREVVIDPRDRSLQPPSVTLAVGEYGHDQVVQLACDMAGGGDR